MLTLCERVRHTVLSFQHLFAALIFAVFFVSLGVSMPGFSVLSIRDMTAAQTQVSV